VKRYLRGLTVGALATGTGLLLSLVLSLPMPMRGWALLCLAGTLPADLVILKMLRLL
jgi:hypothetical protein